MIQCGNSAVDVPPSEPKPVIVTGDIYHNPDGSISINNPKYLRNGGSHFLSADGDTAYGTCKLFGYKYKIASDSVPAESVKVDKIVFLNYGGLFSQYDKPGDHAVLTSLECRN